MLPHAARKKIANLLFLLTLVLAVSAISAQAQGAAATPTPSAEELRLQEEKRLLELQRDIEQAKKAIRDAQPQEAEPPKPTATPLAGDTTLNEGVRLEAEMVSYRAMSEAANKMVGDIRMRLKQANGSPKNIRSLAIYDAQVVKDWRFYQALFPAFRGQAEDILTNYKDILCKSGSGVDQTFWNIYCVKRGDQVFANNERVTTNVSKDAAITSALALGGNLVKSFIDLAALFRTDTKIEGKSVTIDEAALVAEVFRALKNDYANRGEINLYYPEVFPPRINTAANNSETVKLIGLLFIYKQEVDRLIKAKNAAKESNLNSIKVQVKRRDELATELEQVRPLDEQIDNLVAALKQETVPLFRKKLWEEILDAQTKRRKLSQKSQQELKALIKELEDGPIGNIQATNKQLDAEIKLLTKVNERFQSFADEFVKVGNNGVNALALFIKSEDIENIMTGNESYWLEIKAVSAGGNNRVRKNLIWFFAGARLDHSGGVIVEYTLYDKTGAVVCSDKLSHYEGYKEPKKIKEKGFKDREFTVKEDATPEN